MLFSSRLWILTAAATGHRVPPLRLSGRLSHVLPWLNASSGWQWGSSSCCMVKTRPVFLVTRHYGVSSNSTQLSRWCSRRRESQSLSLLDCSSGSLLHNSGPVGVDSQKGNFHSVNTGSCLRPCFLLFKSVRIILILNLEGYSILKTKSNPTPLPFSHNGLLHLRTVHVQTWLKAMANVLAGLWVRRIITPMEQEKKAESE